MEDKNIFKDHLEKDIRDYNDYTNQVIGVLSFSLGITAMLNKEYTTTIATLSFVFLLLNLVVKQISLNGKVRRYYKGYGALETYIDVFKHSFIYLLGLTFLGLIGAGLIDLEAFKGFSIEAILQTQWDLTNADMRVFLAGLFAHAAALGYFKALLIWQSWI